MGHTFASSLLLLLPTSLAFFSFVLNSQYSFFYLYVLYTLSFHEASSSSSSNPSLRAKKKNQTIFLFFRRALQRRFLRNYMKMDEFVNLKETELRLGLPGTDSGCNNIYKRALPVDTENEAESSTRKTEASPPQKTQIVGWPPVRSYRKNNIQTKKNETDQKGQRMYVKVSMDGAPYLRKIDLNCYKGYSELLKAIEMMFKFCVGEYFEREGYKGSDFVPTYEDKDGDWMLIGDVPWEMFVCSCKRLRIMKESEAKGLGCAV